MVDQAYHRLQNWRKQATECVVIIEGKANTHVYKYKTIVQGGYLIYRHGSLREVEDKVVPTSNYNGQAVGRLAITMQILGQEVDFGGLRLWWQRSWRKGYDI